MDSYIYVYIYIYFYIFIYLIYVWYLYIYTHTYTFVYIFMYWHIYIYTYIHMCARTYMYICTCIHAHIFMYQYTHKYTSNRSCQLTSLHSPTEPNKLWIQTSANSVHVHAKRTRQRNILISSWSRREIFTTCVYAQIIELSNIMTQHLKKDQYSTIK